MTNKTKKFEFAWKCPICKRAEFSQTYEYTIKEESGDGEK
jgi:hypothetical protein